MGEPMANYRPVHDAIARLLDPRGPDLAARHVTVSTALKRSQQRRKLSQVQSFGTLPAPHWPWVAEHEVDGRKARLWVRSTDASGLSRVECRVQDPQGHLYAARPSYGHLVPVEDPMLGRWNYTFPDDFNFRANDGLIPDPLTHGEHTVVWEAVGAVNRPEIARDRFTLP
jgi:hypothetical protein